MTSFGLGSYVSSKVIPTLPLLFFSASPLPSRTLSPTPSCIHRLNLYRSPPSLLRTASETHGRLSRGGLPYVQPFLPGMSSEHIHSCEVNPALLISSLSPLLSKFFTSLHLIELIVFVHPFLVQRHLHCTQPFSSRTIFSRSLSFSLCLSHEGDHPCARQPPQYGHYWLYLRFLFITHFYFVFPLFLLFIYFILAQPSWCSFFMW